MWRPRSTRIVDSQWREDGCDCGLDSEINRYQLCIEETMFLWHDKTWQWMSDLFTAWWAKCRTCTAHANEAEWKVYEKSINYLRRAKFSCGQVNMRDAGIHARATLRAIYYCLQYISNVLFDVQSIWRPMMNGILYKIVGTWIQTKISYRSINIQECMKMDKSREIVIFLKFRLHFGIGTTFSHFHRNEDLK